jgi:hypothetical protein
MDYVNELNNEYDLNLTGISPVFGATVIPKYATRVVVKDLDNGLGRVLYVDDQNRLVANNLELI